MFTSLGCDQSKQDCYLLLPEESHKPVSKRGVEIAIASQKNQVVSPETLFLGLSLLLSLLCGAVQGTDQIGKNLFLYLGAGPLSLSAIIACIAVWTESISALLAPDSP